VALYGVVSKDYFQDTRANLYILFLGTDFIPLVLRNSPQLWMVPRHIVPYEFYLLLHVLHKAFV